MQKNDKNDKEVVVESVFMNYIMLLIIINMEAIMTPQRKEQAKPMFHYFQIEDLVPSDHILRQIDKLVDFSFVRAAVKDCYCPDNGSPGVDPELVVRMLLIGYLYDLSENRLCQEVKMHAEKRFFCHMTSSANFFRGTLESFANFLRESLSSLFIKQKCLNLLRFS